MKIRDFAQSRLDRMSVPVRFTAEDIERMGGSIKTNGSVGDKATINIPNGSLDRKKLSDPETIALMNKAEVIERSFRAGTPFYRDSARFRELAGIAILPGESEVREAGTAGWFTEVATQSWFLNRARLERDSDTDQTMTAIMTWVSARLKSVSHTSNWFVPSDPLVFQLLATDLKGVVVGDLRLPLASFYVELPDGVFHLHREETGWHPVRYLVVTEGEVNQRTIEAHEKLGLPGPAPGRRLLIEMYGATNAKSTSPFDDVWAFHSYRIDNPMSDLEEAITNSLSDPEIERTHLKGMIGDTSLGGGRVLDGIEIRREILRFLMNLCIYMASSEARIEHFYQAEIDRLMKGKKLKNLRKNVQDKARALLSERIFRVGSDVTVANEIREYVLSASGTGTKLAYRTVVRGHWRNQAHGRHRALRTQKWIAPHVRGADLPTPIAGHTYEVR